MNEDKITISLVLYLFSYYIDYNFICTILGKNGTRKAEDI